MIGHSFEKLPDGTVRFQDRGIDGSWNSDIFDEDDILKIFKVLNPKVTVIQNKGDVVGVFMSRAKAFEYINLVMNKGEELHCTIFETEVK